MYNLLEAIRICTTLLLPFIPASCEKIFAQIGADASVQTWDKANVWGALPQTVSVHKGEAIFPRVDAAKALAELEEIEAEQKKALLPAVEVEPQLEEKVDFDTFCKSDLRASQGQGLRPREKVRQASALHARRRHRHGPSDSLRHRKSSMSRKRSSARRSPRSLTCRLEK